jgi:hypothetical protein
MARAAYVNLSRISISISPYRLQVDKHPGEDGTEMCIQLVHKHSSETPHLFKTKDNTRFRKMLEAFVKKKEAGSLHMVVFAFILATFLGIESMGTIHYRQKSEGVASSL